MTSAAPDRQAVDNRAPAAAPSTQATVERQPVPEVQFRPFAERWSVPLSAPPLGSPLTAGDIVVVALQPKGVVAFRGSDGSQVWQCDLATNLPLAVDEERVYLFADESIYALSVSEGKELWRRASTALTAPLLVHSGWVIAASRGNIAAYRAVDGAPVWQQPLGVIEYQPAIDGDALFVPLLDREVAALKLQNGEMLWRRPLEGEPGQPLAIGGKVYVGARDRTLYTLDAENGESQSPIRVGAGPRGRPNADDDHVYLVSLDNIVRAYDRGNGALKWHKALKYRPSGGAVLMSGAVVVPGPVSTIPVYRPENGDPFGEITFPATLVAMSNVLYGPWNYPLFVVVTGDLQHPWTLSFLEPSTDPPPLPLVALTEVPGTTIPIALPQ